MNLGPGIHKHEVCPTNQRIITNLNNLNSDVTTKTQSGYWKQNHVTCFLVCDNISRWKNCSTKSVLMLNHSKHRFCFFTLWGKSDLFLKLPTSSPSKLSFCWTIFSYRVPPAKENQAKKKKKKGWLFVHTTCYEKKV